VAWLVAALAQRAAPTFGLVASLIGIACGAFLAGKAAKRAPMYQGVVVGVAYVLALAVGVVPGLIGPGDGSPADTVSVAAGDLILLAIGAAAGWLARPSSSSGTGTAG